MKLYAGKSCLIFELQDAHYGISTDAILEILQLPELTPLDEAPTYIAGVVNCRGEVLSVIDLNTFFGHRNQRYRLSDCIIALEYDEIRVGIIVNKALDVRRISRTEIESVPNDSQADELPHFITCVARIGEMIIMLLDHERLIHHYRDIEGTLKAPQLRRGTTVGKKKAVKKKGNEKTLPVGEQPLIFCPEAVAQERRIFHARATALIQTVREIDTSGRLPLVVIDLGGEYYGVRLEHVLEFLKLGTLRPVPCTPAHIVGNINLRGDILTVVDIRGALGVQPVTLHAGGAKAVVVKVGDIVAGLPVEAVHDVIHLAPADIKPVPAALHAGGECDFLEGMSSYGNGMLSILNLPKLFSEGNLVVDEMV